MKENQFIEKNKSRWQRAEEILSDKELHADELSALLIAITDDLAYARTFYPNRYIKEYLNNLTNAIFQKIYQKKTNRIQHILDFWTKDLPPIIWSMRRELLFSLCCFIIMFCIGIFSSIYNQTFIYEILGTDYVNQTLDNIRNGDPMAIYKDSKEIDMAFAISINNVKVSILSYVGGFFMGLGSLYILIQNGIMVGVFQYFFIQHGIGIHSASTIWLHGTLEISCIIIACGAGLSLGMSYLFPGRRTRLQNLLHKGRDSFLLMVGIIPLILAAAFIESFITRYSFAPLALKLMLIVTCLIFIIYFFIVLPFKKRNQVSPLTESYSLINYDNELLNSANNDLSDKVTLTLHSYTNLKPRYFYASIIFAISLSILHYFFATDTAVFNFNKIKDMAYLILSVFIGIFQSISFNSSYEIMFCVLFLAILFTELKKQIANSGIRNASMTKHYIVDFIKSFLFIGILLASFSYSIYIGTLAMFLVPGLIVILFGDSLYHDVYDYKSNNALTLGFRHFVNFYWSVTLSLIYILIICIMVSSPIVFLIKSSISTLLGDGTNILIENIIRLIPIFFFYLSLFLLLPILIIPIYLTANHALEIEQNKKLIIRIKQIAINKE